MESPIATHRTGCWIKEVNKAETTRMQISLLIFKINENPTERNANFIGLLVIAKSGRLRYIQNFELFVDFRISCLIVTRCANNTKGTTKAGNNRKGTNCIAKLG
jgi:hypothetical protein